MQTRFFNVFFKFSWISEPKFRLFFHRFLDSKRKHRFCKNSAPACTGARFLRFRGIWNQQKNRCKIRTKKWYVSSPADFQKHEKSQEMCFRTPGKASWFFNKKFNVFWPETAQRRLQFASDYSETVFQYDLIIKHYKKYNCAFILILCYAQTYHLSI